MAMEEHLFKATEPQYVSRGMALIRRYKHRQLRTVAECLELQHWLQMAYLENPLVDLEQRDKARLIYAGVEVVRTDLEYQDALRS
jgi:hypothetical protein